VTTKLGFNADANEEAKDDADDKGCAVEGEEKVIGVGGDDALGRLSGMSGAAEEAGEDAVDVGRFFIPTTGMSVDEENVDANG